MGSKGADRFGRANCDLFLASALFLFLELAIIRWLPAHVLFLTFFTNTVLLASFLGFSCGCMVARQPRNYLLATPACLAITLAAGLGMEWIRLALQDVIDVGGNKGAPQVVYFGSEARVADVASFSVPIEWVAGIFFVLAAVTTVGPGQAVGRGFAALPSQVKAYIINIAGSLTGVLLFCGCSLWLSPIWWFGIVGAGIAYFLMRDAPRRWWAIGLAALAPLLLLSPRYAVGVIRRQFPLEFWSPYYRVNYSPATRAIVVNLLGHQAMVSRREPFPAYAIPYLLNRDAGQPRFHEILIIGAGSGNDVSRALEWAAPDAHIDAVEIDPVIYNLGRRDHPDRPYDDSRVTIHLTDGRNFLRSTRRKYDLIVYALVDSLVLHSSISNIRLESFLFTREAMEDVRSRLEPDGLFVMYNYFRQGWIVSRLAKTAELVFDRPPVALTLPQREEITVNEKAEGFTLLFEGPRAEALRRAFLVHGAYEIDAAQAPSPSSPDGFERIGSGRVIRLEPTRVETPAGLRVAEDAWPFLYVRNPMIPGLSWRGIGIMGLSALAMLWLFGRRLGGAAAPAGFDGIMLLLGCGFMLLETKAVVHMSLIFGATWTVNAVVISAVLLMIIAANVYVLKWNRFGPAPFYVGLLAALAVNVAVPLDSFLGWPRIAEGSAAAIMVLSPVFFAGVIFAMLFKRARSPDRSLAYNTAGAMLGGFAETGSLLIGFQFLLAIAAAVYLASWLWLRSAVPAVDR